MLIVLSGQKRPRYFSEFVVTIKGYFENNECFTDMEHGDASTVEKVYKAYLFQKNAKFKYRRSLPEFHQKHIKGLAYNWNILPVEISEISLLYYDELGNPNDVEVR